MQPMSRAEARAVDAWAAAVLGLPTLVLMENAGRGAAEWLRERTGGQGTVLVACGPGNNGGDGGVLARHLDLWGFLVRVAWFAPAERLAPDPAVQHRALGGLGVDQRTIAGPDDLRALASLIAGADWVVDGLLGTGLTRPVGGMLRDAIDVMNGSGRPILALDLPSGLDADGGQPLGVAVRATVTATFVAPKLGFSVPGASTFTGEVRVIDIGVPARRARDRGPRPPAQ